MLTKKQISKNLGVELHLVNYIIRKYKIGTKGEYSNQTFDRQKPLNYLPTMQNGV